jgi:hypothetical protein
MPVLSKKSGNKGFVPMLIQHGEKIVVGCIALLALFILFTSRWAPDTRNPVELDKKISTSRTAIESAPWPEEKREEYTKLHQDDLRNRVQEAFNAISASKYRFDYPFWVSISGESEPVREPRWLGIEHLIARPGKVILAQAKAELLTATATPEATKTTTPEPNKNDGPNEFSPLTGLNNGPGMGGPGMGAPGMEGMPGMMNGPPPGEMAFMNDPYANMEGNALVSNLEGVPVSFVSVCGVFQRRHQIDALADAMHVKPDIAEPYLQFYDFLLERQEALSGVDPWGGPWKPVDVQVSLDVLGKSPDWASDVVSAAITDPVITMPLPSRLMGVWNNFVDHPDLKEFALSPQEMQIEAELNYKAFEKMKTTIDSTQKQKLTPRGFSGAQRFARQAQSDYVSGMSQDKLMNDLAAELKNYDNDAKKMIIQRIKQRVSAEGNLILFRYIDFDVRPGRAYRYRVKLNLANPNYGVPVENAQQISVVEGETRESPWSNVTDVALVEPDMHYFVKRVDLSRTYGEPSATLSMYEINPDSGTLVLADLQVNIGDYLGGTKKTHIIRPDVGTYEEEDVTFKSSQLLLDVKTTSKLVTDQHPDLTLPPRYAGDIGVPAMTLVLNDFGTLDAKYQGSNYLEEKKIQDKFNTQNDAWKDRKDRGKQASDAMNSLEGPGMEGSSSGMMMEGEYGSGGLGQFGNKNRNRNSLRKNTSLNRKTSSSSSSSP